MRHTTRLLALPPALLLPSIAFAQKSGTASPAPSLDWNKVLFGAIANMLPTLFIDLWWMWAILIGIVVIKWAYRQWEKKRLLQSGIGQIDTMGGQTFEKYLEALFEKQGYRVERTAYAGDWGADLIRSKEGVRTVVQAKRYKKKVGVRAVQEAVAAKGKYSCAEAMVVTNSYYTDQARELARANKVALRDRDWLVRALLTLGTETATASASSMPPPPAPATSPEPFVYAEDEQSDICVVCGQGVSPAVRAYCLANAQRFGGRVFCYVHQKKRFVED